MANADGIPNFIPTGFDFTGPKNVFKFLELAQKHGLDVIFRGLPYRSPGSNA